MRLIALALLALTACDAAVSREPADPRTSAIVGQARAIDGDTVSFNVRLHGADAYETRQMCAAASGCWPCGKAAQDYASKLLKSGPATLRLTGSASYGRPVGTVEIGGRDLGEAMIAAGLAIPVTGYLKGQPDQAQRYIAAYDAARAARRGAHAGSFIEPARWRRGERLACEAKPARR
jgi:endonuclease YncB( thermonuclease family)